MGSMTRDVKAAERIADRLIRCQERLEQAQVAVSRLSAERDRLVRDLHAAGVSFAVIARIIGVSRQRAQQLADRADTEDDR